ncbi:hypothetical protein NEUTE1DRAFT_45326 [Neurospora tetrasperma FGSC 2508]|uniref:Uncharacterized protein n=1 Tax=Neurospora tetrasperma (strain FGSC 2508 / ATCC MYA-4615 / P0657) TaxID=510951 RepID=F8MP12_NEUT8|nr:uncharacterized protein NEUTE1DRAFT_45326 [Neurospora tetrasperma FGSC 2508]EGO56231.1 hypothetical protein NEUTE1DRAFT_45326 [Neurospora tetrasperma FGSC 2508]EGZ70916.1 hypothetical protein NEUTE2DRAFT_140259 [Neurospora tetrasperma FGSC 2509]
MPESYYSSASYTHPVEYYINSGRGPGSTAGSVAPSTASSQSTIRPTYVNSQGQLGIDYPASQISSRGASRQSHQGSYHSLRDVDPSDSSSQVGSVVSTNSRASRASHASTVRPDDSLSQVGASSSSGGMNRSSHPRGRGRDLSARELSLLHAQGGSHAPTVVSLASTTQSQNQGGPQLLPYADSDAGGGGSDFSTDSTLVIDMRRDSNRRQQQQQPPPRSSSSSNQQHGGNNGGGNGGGGNGRNTYPSEPPNVVVTEADIARGREMWPGLDRESIKCRMKVVLIREEVQRRARVHLGFR